MLDNNNQYTEEAKNLHEAMYEQIFQISPSSNGSLNEKRFMAFLETQNSGLKVLKANDNTFNNWSVLARISDGTVMSINCNN